MARRARFLQRQAGPVKMWAAVGCAVGRKRRQAVVFAGDLLDQIDDAAAQLGVLDAHERLGQREAVGGREEIRHVGGRGRFGQAVAPAGRRRARLRRKTTPAPAGSARSAAAGWRRSGWCPFRISAPAGTSGRARRRASPGSCPASCAACARGSRHACRSGWAPSWPCRSPVEPPYAPHNLMHVTRESNRTG